MNAVLKREIAREVLRQSLARVAHDPNNFKRPKPVPRRGRRLKFRLR